MSYQTVADIFAGTQNNFDYQKNNSLKDSSLSSSNSSFGELVSFYKSEKNNSGVYGSSPANQDSDSNVTRPEDKVIKSENNEKPNDKAAGSTAIDDEKSVSSSEDKVTEERSKSSEVETHEETGASENNTDSKKKISDKDYKSGADSIEESHAAEKKGKNPKNKKLSDKDFSRIHELISKEESINEKNSENAGVLTEKKADLIADNSDNLEDVANSSKKGALKKNRKEDGKGIVEDNVKNRDKSKDNDVIAEELKHSTEDAAKNAGAVAAAAENTNKTSKSEDNNIDNNDLLKNSEKNDDLEFLKEGKDSGDKLFMDKDKKISVEDLRTDKNIAISNAEHENVDAKSKLKLSEPKLVNENTANMTMDLRQNVNANVMSSSGQTASANGSNFQAMLNNQIQQSAPEFVKAGNLILKDNNQGTINLLLRPDELGNVKLHLSLDGKNISGHITVATKEAFEVFKDNGETLREAFIKNGFDSANFTVSYGGSGANGQGEAFQQQNDGADFLAKKVYESHSEKADGDFDKIIEKNDKNKEYSINIVA